MFDRERNTYRFGLALVERLTADVSDDELSQQPIPGMNPPRWILAHLAVVSDSCLQLLGKPAVRPRAWHQAFGPGSKHDAEVAPRPTKSELLAALADSHARVLAALDAADEALLDQPHGITFESFDKIFPTRGDLLATLMTVHEALHIGQLSAWRRASGRPPLF